MRKCQQVGRRFSRWCAGLVRHLPEGGYHSNHPWSEHHDPSRPRSSEPIRPVRRTEPTAVETSVTDR